MMARDRADTRKPLLFLASPLPCVGSAPCLRRRGRGLSPPGVVASASRARARHVEKILVSANFEFLCPPTSVCTIDHTCYNVAFGRRQARPDDIADTAPVALARSLAPPGRVLRVSWEVRMSLSCRVSRATITTCRHGVPSPASRATKSARMAKGYVTCGRTLRTY